MDRSVPNVALFDAVHQGRHALDPHFEFVTRLYRAYTARRPRQNNVARKQCHVGRNKTYQLKAVEDHLAGVAVLTQLTILEELDAQIVWINLSLHIRSEWREGIERFSASPLALSRLDRPVGNVLCRGVSKDVTRGGGRGHISHPPADNHRQFGLKIGSMSREWNLDLRTIRDERGRGLKPEEGFLRQWLAGFSGVIGVVQSHGDNLGRLDWRQSF